VGLSIEIIRRLDVFGAHTCRVIGPLSDPRINIQNNKGKAKAYQVKQVLLAIDKLEVENATEK
jgi:hypothetical protein